MTDSLRLMLAQGGSSLCLLAFLVAFRVCLNQLYSQAHLNQHHVVPSQDTHLELVSGQDSIPTQQSLRESLRILEQDPDCSMLLKCLSFGLEVHITNANEFQRCKENYRECKSHGHLNHLNKLLESVDNVS